MRTFITTLLAIVLSTLVPVVAYADEASPQTSYAFGNGVSYPMTFDGKGLPPTILHSVAVGVPLSDSWRFITKIGVTSPLTTTQLAPQLQLGAITKFNDHFLLGASGIYRYIPHWNGTPSDANVVGGSIAPTFLLTGKILVAIPVAITRNLTTNVTVIAQGVELLFPL